MVATAWSTESPWNRSHSGSGYLSARIWGQVLGSGTRSSDGTVGAQDVCRAAVEREPDRGDCERAEHLVDDVQRRLLFGVSARSRAEKRWEPPT